MLDPPPAFLGGLEQFEDHCQAHVPGTAVPAALRPQEGRGERGLDRVGGADVHPMLCWEVIERQQFAPILGRAVHRLGVLGAKALQRSAEGLIGCLPRLGHPDLV